jgi:hypothetical protein
MNFANDERPRTYLPFSPNAGYPAGTDLFYECGRCGDVIPSMPADSTHCRCRNIMIDVDYGRVSIEDHNQVRLFTVT